MTRRLIWDPDAVGDLVQIWLYLASDDPPAADRFVDRLVAKCQRLIEFPESGRARPELGEGVRSLTVGNYVVFYRATTEEIQVARVLHGARDLDQLFDT